MTIEPLPGTSPWAAAPAAPVTSELTASHRDVIMAVSALNRAQLLGSENELTFSLDRQTRLPMVQIVNRRTREVVEQIPPESVLQVASSIRAEENR